jgi:acetolactate synthase I/II/III large subunit
MVNIVGDHATYHKQYDAPLSSDVEGVARPFSDWVRTATDSRSVARDGAAAVAAAMAPPGRVATLILPADAIPIFQAFLVSHYCETHRT